MSSGIGTATIDFGSTGANEASVAVTGQGSISATSKAEAWVMGDDTSSNHTASDHKYFTLFANLSCGAPTASTGFTIYSRSTQKMTGQFTVRWVWSD